MFKKSGGNVCHRIDTIHVKFEDTESKVDYLTVLFLPRSTQFVNSQQLKDCHRVGKNSYNEVSFTLFFVFCFFWDSRHLARKRKLLRLISTEVNQSLLFPT